MSSYPVIVTKDVCKTYGSGAIKVDALINVNIVINRGDHIAIMGPSGSGKSTLMNIIGCLDTVTSGQLFIDNIDVSTLKENQLAKIRREKIGFIFQKYNLIPTLTALENITLVMGFAGVDTKTRNIRAKDLLEMVGLSHRVDHKPSELSGGEQQRVAIARSLANNPPIILGDEPTGNVDTSSGKKILEILENINKRGDTIITVTHDLAVAQRARRIIRIQDGVVSEEHV